MALADPGGGGGGSCGGPSEPPRGDFPGGHRWTAASGFCGAAAQAVRGFEAGLPKESEQVRFVAGMKRRSSERRERCHWGLASVRLSVKGGSVVESVGKREQD
jgi:hypothetical protein